LRAASTSLPRSRSAEQLKKAQEADQDHKASLDRIPDQRPADPWGKAR
jgi:hypothetical protein